MRSTWTTSRIGAADTLFHATPLPITLKTSKRCHHKSRTIVPRGYPERSRRARELYFRINSAPIALQDLSAPSTPFNATKFVSENSFPFTLGCLNNRARNRPRFFLNSPSCAQLQESRLPTAANKTLALQHRRNKSALARQTWTRREWSNNSELSVYSVSNTGWTKRVKPWKSRI